MSGDDAHIAEHFTSGGLCQCPCSDCTSRIGRFCFCLDCPCDPDDPEAPQHGEAAFAEPGQS